MKQSLKIYPFPELQKTAPLFSGWNDTMIFSCLQGIMGVICAPDTEHPVSAAAQLNDFCFLAGIPDARLITFDYGRDFLILTPQTDDWCRLIETVCGSRAVPRTRYAIQKDPDCFDRKKLKELAGSLPEEYEIRPIDRTLYAQCLAQDWSADLVSGFPDYETFARLGLGFAALRDGVPVSGASSYSRYRGGIEIEVDTRVDYRRRGLACAVSAALITACLDRGLYPSWDAQNLGSVHLSQKLGYSFSHEYRVYEYTRT